MSMKVDDEYSYVPTEEHLPTKRKLMFSGKPLADFIMKRRADLCLSLPQLEARTGIHQSRLNRWERGLEQPRRIERLSALARGLEVPVADLYLLVGMELNTELPSLRPYLRSKYGKSLPPAARQQIERIAAQYGINNGPAHGEDE